MCNPASVALTAGGALASYQGKRRADRAMTSARAAERTRQEGLRQEAEGVWNGALPQMGADAAQGEMAASQARRAASEAALAGPAITLPGLSTGNRAVSDAVASESATQGARVAATGAARRELDSFGDAMLGQGLVRADTGQRIGSINGMRRGSAAVLPIELQAASRRGAGLQTIGTMLSTLGAGAAYSAGAAGTVPWWEQLRTLGATPAAAPVSAGIPGGAELAAAYLRG